MAQVDESPWDRAAVMAAGASSDDPAAFYEAVCAGRREGDPAVQSTWALPHHAAPGDGPNADGTRAAMSRIGQAQGLVNHDEALAHLTAHMNDIHAEMDMAAEPPAGEPVEASARGPMRTLDFPGGHELSIDAGQRRLGLRIIPYGVVAEHPRYGRLLFEQGAFGTVDPTAVRLRMDHQDPPTGLGRTFTETPAGAFMEFQVSTTDRGDEQLTLARDGVSRGASVGFMDAGRGPAVRSVDGKPTTVYGPGSASLAEVSTTWQPTFADAGVMYALHAQEKGSGPVGNQDQEAPVAGAAPIDYDRMALAIAAASAKGASESKVEVVLSKFEELMELQRSQFSTPPPADKPKAMLKDWFGITLRRLAGAPVTETEIKALALDDIISSEQPGLVPAVFTADYDDLISQDRPFLMSTREVRPPATGSTITLPIITTRAVAGTQAGGQKTEVTTTGPKVGTATFNAASIFAGADVSIQMILRADRSFLDLLDAEFGEAYALDEDSKAIAALLTGYTDSASNLRVPTDGGVMDPEDPHFGDAFLNSVLACKRRPDHIWMSATAVAAFIDAKSPTTNAPLYSNLAAAFTAGGGAGGVLSGLVPVYVPALDTSAVDVIVGPSRGFVWAEDPAVRLQADNASLAGRDILLAGTLFPAPRYADAFTTYTVAS